LQSIAPRHDVVESTGEFDTDLAWHGGGWQEGGFGSRLLIAHLTPFLTPFLKNLFAVRIENVCDAVVLVIVDAGGEHGSGTGLG